MFQNMPIPKLPANREGLWVFIDSDAIPIETLRYHVWMRSRNSEWQVEHTQSPRAHHREIPVYSGAYNEAYLSEREKAVCKPDRSLKLLPRCFYFILIEALKKSFTGLARQAYQKSKSVEQVFEETWRQRTKRTAPRSKSTFMVNIKARIWIGSQRRKLTSTDFVFGYQYRVLTVHAMFSKNNVLKT